jgi:hypothetical protein
LQANDAKVKFVSRIAAIIPRRKPLAGAADAGVLWEFNRFEKACQTGILAKTLLLMLM